MTDLIFCKQCDNLIIPKKEGNRVSFNCGCGYIDPHTIKIKIKKTSPLDENYNYPNKIASRLINRNYLQEQRDLKLIKPFKHQKVIILTQNNRLGKAVW